MQSAIDGLVIGHFVIGIGFIECRAAEFGQDSAFGIRLFGQRFARRVVLGRNVQFLDKRQGLIVDSFVGSLTMLSAKARTSLFLLIS